MVTNPLVPLAVSASRQFARCDVKRGSVKHDGDQRGLTKAVVGVLGHLPGLAQNGSLGTLNQPLRHTSSLRLSLQRDIPHPVRRPLSCQERPLHRLAPLPQLRLALPGHVQASLSLLHLTRMLRPQLLRQCRLSSHMHALCQFLSINQLQNSI